LKFLHAHARQARNKSFFSNCFPQLKLLRQFVPVCAHVVSISVLIPHQAECTPMSEAHEAFKGGYWSNISLNVRPAQRADRFIDRDILVVSHLHCLNG
jgi:hypothetical protein